MTSKTLLITDVPPSRKSSGTLLTWHLCKNFSAQSLVGYFLVSRGLENMPVEFPFEGGVVYERQIKRYDGSFRPRIIPRFLTFISSFSREIFRKYFEVPRYARRITKFAAENGADRIWIILQGQTMIWLAEYFIKKNFFPVHVQVWDSPKWWVKARGLDYFSGKLIKNSYSYCLAHAHKFASASFPMSADYVQKYGKPSQVLIGIIPSSHIVYDTPKRDKSKFIIGIAGQIYATDTFESLIDALDSTYWEIDGRKVEIHYWGNSGMPVERTRIVSRGYVDQDKLTRELSFCDLLYCPYWFNPDFKEESETSFPSKLITYLAANTMVLFHGPSYSSPINVLEQGHAALCCTSSDPEVIKFNLRKSMYLPNREEIIGNAKKLLFGKFGEDYLHASFKEFLDLR